MAPGEPAQVLAEERRNGGREADGSSRTMERSLRIYCFVALILATVVALFGGLATKVSIQSARHQLHEVASTLAPAP
jgi:hypothetical protein